MENWITWAALTIGTTFGLFLGAGLGAHRLEYWKRRAIHAEDVAKSIGREYAEVIVKTGEKPAPHLVLIQDGDLS